LPPYASEKTYKLVYIIDNALKSTRCYNNKMDPKAKILYVITKSNWGGAQKYVFDLATSVPQNQFEVIVAFGGDGALKDKLTQCGIRTIQIQKLKRDFSIFKDLQVFFEILKIYRKERPNIVHLNSSKMGVLGSLAARLIGVKKIIFTAHGWAFNEKRSSTVRLIIWKLSWLTALLSTDIIVLSEKERRQAQHLPLVSHRKIHLIRNGIKRENVLTREEALHKLDLDPERRYIGTISELHKNKGLETLIRSAMYIKTEVVIIGAGEEERALNKIAKNIGISKKMHFLGAVENAGLCVKAFDVFTLTSRKEGLPYVLLEAGYAGIPAVASNVGGISEIIIDGKTGLLSKPNDSKDVREKIQRILQDPKYAKELGDEAHKHIEQNFMFEKTLELTLNIYKS